MIKVSVKDYTLDPGPRYKRQDNKEGLDTSGEMFYIKVLNSCFKECLESNKRLIIVLDGVSGYPSSFLDEAIGELVYDFTLEKVSSILSFETMMFNRRTKQVEEETFPQWEQRRLNRDTVVHSPNIAATLFKLDENSSIVKYTIQ